MTIKQIFKSIEGIIVLGASAGVILTGAKIFTYAGIGGYLAVNIFGAEVVQSKIKAFFNFIGKKLGLIKE